MTFDPSASNLLLIMGVVILCGLTTLFILAVAAFFAYRYFSKQQGQKITSAEQRSVKSQPEQPQGSALPTIPPGAIGDEQDLVSFDDAIEISLEIIKSSNLEQATEYLGQELKQEDLNTIWVISDLITDILLQEGVSSDEASMLVKKYKSSLRNMPKMVQAFGEFPSSGRETMEMGDLIDGLLESYLEVKDFPEGEVFLDKNPVLVTMYADMHITTLALQQFLEANKSSFWEIKKKITVHRAAQSAE